MKYHYTNEQVELLETRSSKGDSTAKFAGYGAVFYDPNNPEQTEYVMSESPRYVERIKPHAFDETLNKRIKLLYEHNSDWHLDNTDSQLNLRVDQKGLYFESPSASETDDEQCKTVANKVRRRIVRGSSIGFPDAGTKYSWTTEGNTRVCWLEKINLEEISLVSDPAYPGTSSAIRSLKDMELDYLKSVSKELENEFSQMK